MLKALNKEVKDNRGFTLIELVIVIAIIGLLVAIAVPRMADARKKAAIATHNANVRTLEGAANMYMAEEGLPDANAGKDEVAPYVQEWPKVPKGTGVLKDGTPDEGAEYTITIDTNGNIEVEPWYVDIDDEGNATIRTRGGTGGN